MNKKQLFLLIVICFLSTLLFSQSDAYSSSQALPATKLYFFPTMYQVPIHTILVIPPVNDTNNDVIGNTLKSIVNEEFTSYGYYTIPMIVGESILAEEGFQYRQSLGLSQLQLLKQKYNVDAVLYLNVSEYKTSRFLLTTGISVFLDYKLVSTESGGTIWYHSAESSLNTSNLVSLESMLNGSSGFSIASTLLNWGMKSLPAGSYSPAYRKDQNKSCYPNTRHETEWGKTYNPQFNNPPVFRM